jgi:hypothetical protein
VGCLFLFVPGKVLIFFNSLSTYLGLNQSPVPDFDFYVILAVAYMYLVTLVAFLMYKHPENSYFPLLLANGKLASSLLSLCIFIFYQPYLILAVNCAVDGLIGIAAFAFYRKIKSRGA